MITIEEIKEKALEEHIPIIMDDSLEVIKEILLKEKPKNILEIGTATGYSAICFATIILKNYNGNNTQIPINKTQYQ